MWNVKRSRWADAATDLADRIMVWYYQPDVDPT
jgi:hypothetical protein